MAAHDSGSTSTLPASVHLPHAATSPHAARQAIRRDLECRGVAATASDAAELVVSELVSNAVRHARALPSGRLRLTWAVGDDSIDVAVSDGGSSTRPRQMPISVSSTGGRGLSIVQNVAADWGVTDSAGGTTVWARVPTGADDESSDPARGSIAEPGSQAQRLIQLPRG